MKLKPGQVQEKNPEYLRLRSLRMTKERALPRLGVSKPDAVVDNTYPGFKDKPPPRRDEEQQLEWSHSRNKYVSRKYTSSCR